MVLLMLKLLNTLTRKKEIFKPLKNKEVRLYTCGPTTYDFAHIGNFRTYVWQDILKRWLVLRGFKVKHVMNLTDVDDKTIKGARKEGVPLKEFTERYNKAFFEDMKTLNIIPANAFPRATGHIKEMVGMIKILMKRGFAYKTNDAIYFDISKFKNYGKLSKLKINELKAGARIRTDLYTKEEAQDFALWKFWDQEDGNVFWDTQIGKGRPGWHLECSVMSMKYLGKTFDVHTGGIDLIFPHHENEIAQSEATTGKKFVNYWLHGEHLLVEGQKMSKSLGNFYTLRDILDKGYDAKVIRYLLLSANFKHQLNFTFQSLDAAKNTVGSLFNFLNRLKDVKNNKSNSKVKGLIKKVQKEFSDAMDYNLNTNSALASLFKFINGINNLIDSNGVGKSDAKAVRNVILDFDKILGLDLKSALKERKLPKEAEQLIEDRKSARAKGDYKIADGIRKRLEEEFGIVLEDTKYGVKWKKA